MKLLIQSLAVLSSISYSHAACEPEHAFHPPQYPKNVLKDTFSQIKGSLSTLIAQQTFSTTSFALEISSSQQTLFTSYYTNPTARPATVDGSTAFRIESNTKVFVALAILQQEALGKLSLDDSVSVYHPDLEALDASFDWSRITIRTLLSHTGGLPDTFGDGDLLLQLDDPTAYGLPPPSPSAVASLPKCGLFSNYTIPCTESDLLHGISDFSPVSPPKAETSYSNIGFDLLGSVITNVTGTDFREYIAASILQPLGMKNTSFSPPEQSAAKLPFPSAWAQEAGIDAAAGGLYSTSADMMKFLRYCLVKRDNITDSLDWFNPAAYSTGSHSFLGYPWEIFRSTSILPKSSRPVTFITKGGGGVEYYSYSIILPEYDLVIFMAAAGELVALESVLAAVRNTLVTGAEQIAQTDLKTSYAGTYSVSACKSQICATNPKGLNSSITLSQSPSKSLYISSFTSNSTDTLSALLAVSGSTSGQTSTQVYFGLTPMFLTRDIMQPHDGTRVGEVWRFINVIDSTCVTPNATNVWDDYCVSNLDPLRYAGVSVNEVVFWRESAGKPVSEIEVPAFQVVMGRQRK